MMCHCEAQPKQSLLLWAILICFVSVDFTSAASWKAFRRGAGREGFINEQAYPYAANPPGWNYNVFSPVLSSPAVKDGVIYFGSRDGSVWALNALTGEVLWQYSTSGWVDSTPVVGDSFVYVLSRDGVVYCFKKKYGEEEDMRPVWEYNTSATNCSSPLYTDGKIIFLTGPAFAGTEQKAYLYSLDALTGALVEKRQLGQFSYSSVATDKDRFYFCTSDGNFNCYEGGKPLWTKKTMGGLYFTTLAVKDGKVYGYAGSIDNRVYSISGDGSVLWSSPELSNVATDGTSISVAGDKVVVNVYPFGKGWNGSQYTSWAGRLYCLDLQNGTTLWFKEYTPAIDPSKSYGLTSSPAIAGKVVYVGTTEEVLYALDIDSGTVIANYSLDGGIVASPAVSNGWIYIGTLSGKFYGIKAEKITAISSPDDGDSVGGRVPLKGHVVQKPAEYEKYRIDYSLNDNPSVYGTIAESSATPSIEGDTLATWDVTGLPQGEYTVKLYTLGSTGGVLGSAAVQYFVNQSTSVFVGRQGGTLQFFSDGTEIVIPEGAVEQTVEISARKYTDQEDWTGKNTGIPSDVRAAGDAREFTVSPLVEFSKNVTIKLPYELGKSGISLSAKEKNLRLFWWDADKNKWRMVNNSTPHSDDTPKRVWADIPHFSTYRVGEFISSDTLLLDVYTYPNPARLTDKLYFKFSLGAEKTDVIIDVYNVAGELVAHLVRPGQDDDAGQVRQFEWDISNIASGMYVYRVEANSSGRKQSVTKKLAIIH
ncbi:MAG: PQQ-binding-like beta-propeller repeat protein [Elusimicrobiota bacterium]